MIAWPSSGLMVDGPYPRVGVLPPDYEVWKDWSMSLGFVQLPTRAELQERDAEVRRRVLAREVDPGCELHLVQSLANSSRDLLPSHPYLLAFEWEVRPGHSQFGVGDLVFGNETGRLAAVEIKWIPEGPGRSTRVKRTKQRGKVWTQARKYAEALWCHVPWAAEVEARVWTNEAENPELIGRFGPCTAVGRTARTVERARWEPSLPPRHVVPAVGRAFQEPSPDLLRVAVVNDLAPEGWPGDVGLDERALAGVRTLASALGGSGAVGRATSGGTGDLYISHAVKVQLDTAQRSRTWSVDFWRRDGRTTWARELAALASVGALPHLVVVFGVRAWKATLAAGWPTRAPGLLGPRLARVALRSGEAEQGVVMVRLPHPRSPNRTWDAERLAEHPGFQEFVQ